jgi:hypothetical protein
MQCPHIEERTTPNFSVMAQDIALKLSNDPNTAIVVCERPEVLASLVSKKWQQLRRAVLKKHASTLDAQKREELSQKIEWMRSRKFSPAGKPGQLETAHTDVLCCTSGELLRCAPVCHALYITYPIDQKELHSITALLPASGTVMCYRIVPPTKHKVTFTSVGYRLKPIISESTTL